MKKSFCPSSQLVRLVEGDRELLHLHYEGLPDQRHCSYRIEFVNIDERRLSALMNLDPRDVPVEYETVDGLRLRFAGVWANYGPISPNHLYVREVGCYSPTPPQRTGLFAALTKPFRQPQFAVAPERAPRTWYWKSRRSIQAGLKSNAPDDVHTAVAFASMVGPKDAEWALHILEEYIEHSNPEIRCAAARGIGELARCYGVAGDNARTLLEQMKSPSKGEDERGVAEKALEEILRFASPKST